MRKKTKKIIDKLGINLKNITERLEKENKKQDFERNLNIDKI